MYHGKLELEQVAFSFKVFVNQQLPVKHGRLFIVGYTVPKNINFNGQSKKMDFLCTTFLFYV